MWQPLGGLAVSIPTSEPTDPDLSRCFVSLSCGWLRSLSSQEFWATPAPFLLSPPPFKTLVVLRMLSIPAGKFFHSQIPSPVSNLFLTSTTARTSSPGHHASSYNNNLEIIKICTICGLLASRNPQESLLLPWHWGGRRPEDKAEPGIGKTLCVSWHWRTCWRADFDVDITKSHQIKPETPQRVEFPARYMRGISTFWLHPTQNHRKSPLGRDPEGSSSPAPCPKPSVKKAE